MENFCDIGRGIDIRSNCLKPQQDRTIFEMKKTNAKANEFLVTNG